MSVAAIEGRVADFDPPQNFARRSVIERSHLDCRKPVRCAFYFTRVIGT